MGKVRTGALALVLLLSMVLSGCGQQSTDTSTAEYLSAEVVQAGSAVKTTESYTGDFFIGFEANTRITALRVTELLWEYSGDRYVSIKVKEGDFVSEGDVMVEIAPTISESELLQRELAVTNADIDLVQIRESYEARIIPLEEEIPGLTGTEAEIASARLVQLRAEYNERISRAGQQYRAAVEALEKLKAHKEATCITAPYDGYVASVIRGWEEGGTVPAYQPLITMADTDTLAFRVTNISPFGQVPYLSTVELTDQRDQSVYTGTVVSSGQVTGSGTDDLIIIPHVPADKMGTALTGAVKIKGTVLDKKDVVLMDASALYKEGDRYYVLILSGESAAAKAYVSVGAVNAGTAWIAEGLDPGVTLIIN